MVWNAARNNQRKVAQVGCYVECEAVRSDPFGHMNADRANLPLWARRSGLNNSMPLDDRAIPYSLFPVPCVAAPDAGQPLQPPGADAKAKANPNQCLFHAADKI